MSVDSGRGFVEFRLAFVSLHVTSGCLVCALQDFGIYFNPRLVQRFEERFRGWWARFDRDDVGAAFCLRIRRAPERLKTKFNLFKHLLTNVSTNEDSFTDSGWFIERAPLIWGGTHRQKNRQHCRLGKW